MGYIRFSGNLTFTETVQETELKEKVFYRRNSNRIPLTPMGVLSPGSANVRPSTQTFIYMSGKFAANVSTESPSNISTNSWTHL